MDEWSSNLVMVFSSFSTEVIWWLSLDILGKKGKTMTVGWQSSKIPSVRYQNYVENLLREVAVWPKGCCLWAQLMSNLALSSLISNPNAIINGCSHHNSLGCGRSIQGHGRQCLQTSLLFFIVISNPWFHQYSILFPLEFENSSY